MGIQGLFNLISRHAPVAIQRVPVSHLRGWTIIVDTSIAMHQWAAHGPVLGSTGQPINHIQGALYRATAMIRAGITPIFVFDGVPPAAKDAILAHRRAIRPHHIPTSHFAETAAMLTCAGIQVVQAPGEAEAQAAYMTHTATTPTAVSTEDMDALAFGAKCMIRGLSPSATVVTMITLDDVLKGLGLTMNQFIDLCILLGSDYTRGHIRGVGPVRALGLIRRYGSIERILAEGNVGGGVAGPDFDYVVARGLFVSPAVVMPSPFRPFTPLDAYMQERLRHLLLAHGMAPVRIARALTDLLPKSPE